MNNRFDLDDLVPVRAAIYNRVSLDKDGDELAVKRQHEDAVRLAASREWEVVGTYTDNSVSASKAEVIRPEYEKMRRDYRAGKFDVIICYDLDRLTRQPRQLEDWIDEAEKNGLRIVTLNGEADLGTDGGRMYARIKAAVARAEVERKAARQRRANVQRAEAGHWQFSRRPFGYERRDGKVEIIETEAAVVREIFERYVAGQSLYAIAADLTDRGVPTFGGEWTMNRIRQILRNARYAGLVVHKGQRIEATPSWTPIISERLWSDAQATREGRSRPASWSRSTKHLLAGLMTCDVCGARLTARPDRGRQVYACSEKWCVSISAVDVEPVVEGVVLARLADKKILRALRSSPNTAPIEEELRDLKRRRDDVLDLLADGVLSRQKAREKAQALTGRIEALQARLTAARQESPLTDLAASRAIPSKWGRLDVLKKRRIIEELGLVITIKKSRPGRRPLDAEGNPIPDLDRIAIDWRDSIHP